MKLKLTRPIASFDLETTGKEVETARIVELAFVKLLPDGTRDQLHMLINPGIPIPADSTEVHGITDEKVRDCPKFEDVAKELHQWILGCDLAGFNLLMYDVPVLFYEFYRAGITWKHLLHHVVDAGNIFKIEEPRTLSAAVKLYCGHELENAHSAAADNEATVNVLLGQLDRYSHLPVTVEELAMHSNYGKRRADVSGKFTVDENGEYQLNFGPHRGCPARNHVDFLRWMCQKGFAADTTSICVDVMNGRYKSPIMMPQPPAPPAPPLPVNA